MRSLKQDLAEKRIPESFVKAIMLIQGRRGWYGLDHSSCKIKSHRNDVVATPLEYHFRQRCRWHAKTGLDRIVLAEVGLYWPFERKPVYQA